jgi:pimeloyl-ACP methyl ester carboxylesterase
MAARARLISSDDVRPDCARIAAPTLVITGERHLDHVVPVDGSSEYLRLIPNARAAVLERTGHLGSITRPEAFAEIVRAFVMDVGADPRVRPGPAHGSAPRAGWPDAAA